MTRPRDARDTAGPKEGILRLVARKVRARFRRHRRRVRRRPEERAVQAEGRLEHLGGRLV